MANDRCRLAMLAGLGWLLLFAPACVQRDRLYGAIPAAQSKDDANRPESPASPGDDADCGDNSDADASQSGLEAGVEPAGTAGPDASGADASQPSLDGYWDLVSQHDAATDTTTIVASGTGILYFNSGTVTLYLDNGGTKTCGSSTYTVEGTTIVYVGGNSDSLVVTDTTLRLTTLQAGGLFASKPGNYSDFARLPTFTANGYGPCN